MLIAVKTPLLGESITPIMYYHLPRASSTFAIIAIPSDV